MVLFKSDQWSMHYLNLINGPCIFLLVTYDSFCIADMIICKCEID